MNIYISVFKGIEDELLTVAHMQAWHELTTNRFKLYEITGKHLFVEQQASTVCDRIVAELFVPIF